MIACISGYQLKDLAFIFNLIREFLFLSLALSLSILSFRTQTWTEEIVQLGKRYWGSENHANMRHRVQAHLWKAGSDGVYLKYQTQEDKDRVIPEDPWPASLAYSVSPRSQWEIFFSQKINVDSSWGTIPKVVLWPPYEYTNACAHHIQSKCGWDHGFILFW